MSSWQSYVLTQLLRLNYSRISPSSELNIGKDRRDLDRLGKLFKPLAPIQCTPVMINNIQAEWITPAGTSTERVMLYLHGGAFYYGSTVSHRSLAGNIASACKTRALIIDYRLAPEHPYPCALEDSLAAYEWLLASGIPGDKIAVMGDSAGGTLTLLLLTQLRDLGQPLPRLATCLSPVTDLSMSGESWKYNLEKDFTLHPKIISTAIDTFLGDADPHVPLISPLYADLHGLPPLLIQVGSDEVLLSDATRFAEKAKEAGVAVEVQVWDRMQHVWQLAASFLPEGRQAIMKIGEFVRAVYALDQ